VHLTSAEHDTWVEVCDSINDGLFQARRAMESLESRVWDQPRDDTDETVLAELLPLMNEMDFETMQRLRKIRLLLNVGYRKKGDSHGGPSKNIDNAARDNTTTTTNDITVEFADAGQVGSDENS